MLSHETRVSTQTVQPNQAHRSPALTATSEHRRHPRSLGFAPSPGDLDFVSEPTAAQLAPTRSFAAFGRDIVTAASTGAVGASSVSARGTFDHLGDAVQQCPDFRGQRLLGQERHRPGHLARKESAIQPHSPIPPSATYDRQREECTSWESGPATNPTVLQGLLSGTDPLTHHNTSDKEQCQENDSSLLSSILASKRNV